MAFLILDDDSPESEEYESNYVYFNEKNPECMIHAMKVAKLVREGNPVNGEAVRQELKKCA